MKFVQVIKYNKKRILLQKSWRKQARKDSSRPLFLFQKNFKTSVLQLNFKIFRQLSTSHLIRTNCIRLQTIDPEICSISFFLEKGLEIVFLPSFVYDLSRKCWSCYILLIDQILLLDFLYFLRYWEICVLQLFVNQVVTPFC